MSKNLKTLLRRLRMPINRRHAFRRMAEFHRQPRSLQEVVDIAMDLGTKGLMRISTQQVGSEIHALAEQVAALKPQRILEIGTARGGTLLIWAQLASEQVVSCDLNDMRDQEPVYARFPPEGSSCRVSVLSGDSHSKELKNQVVEALDGQQVDFLFIDGDHTDEGVTADYLDYKELVRPGGLIAFHDIVESQPLETNQVDRLWKKLKPLAETKEYIGSPDQCGFGIGVLHVGPEGAPGLQS